MRRLIAVRFGQGLFALWAVSLIVFGLGRISGDPTYTMMAMDARLEEREAFRERLGLIAPLTTQYAKYLGNMLKGDLGPSLKYPDIGAGGAIVVAGDSLPRWRIFGISPTCWSSSWSARCGQEGYAFRSGIKNFSLARSIHAKFLAGINDDVDILCQTWVVTRRRTRWIQTHYYAGYNSRVISNSRYNQISEIVHVGNTGYRICEIGSYKRGERNEGNMDPLFKKCSSYSFDLFWNVCRCINDRLSYNGNNIFLARYRTTSIPVCSCQRFWTHTRTRIGVCNDFCSL